MTVDKICLGCGKSFRVGQHRAATAKFCSYACNFNSKRKVVACQVCGKLQFRPASRKDYRTTTCSMECRGIATRLLQPRSKLIQSVGRWLRRNGLMEKCERCGYDEEPRILVRHHRDRNRANNSLGNIECLCPNCHALEHLGENLNGWDTRRRRQRERETDAACAISLS